MCESAVAVLFCAADEAALCRPCDEKVRAPLSLTWSPPLPSPATIRRVTRIGPRVGVAASVCCVGPPRVAGCCSDGWVDLELRSWESVDYVRVRMVDLGELS